MKVRSSIFYTITFIFALAAVGVSLALLWLIGYDQQNYTRELNSKYSIVARANLYAKPNMTARSQISSFRRSAMKPSAMRSLQAPKF